MIKAIARKFLKLAMRPLFRVKVEGDVRQFRAERLLIIASHKSFFDSLRC